jgi:transmembrane sensor
MKDTNDHTNKLIQAARYLAHEMEPEEMYAYTTHLDPNGEQLLQQVKNDWKIMEYSENNGHNNTNEAWEKLYTRLESDNLVPPVRTSSIRYTWVTKVAAVIVVLLLVSATYLVIRSLKTTPVIGMNTIHTDVPKTIVLPDGSVVYLNSHAKLSYPKQFQSSVREVSLRGEAFFEIKPNPKQPFTVKAPKTNITVLGTSFHVDASSDSLQVNVKTGKVKVSSEVEKQHFIILLPGERGDVANQRMIKTTNSNDNYMAWKTKKLSFDGEKLQEAIAAINHAYNANIHLSDKIKGEYSLNRIVFNNLPLNTILELLSTTFDLRVEKQGTLIILCPK